MAERALFQEPPEDTGTPLSERFWAMVFFLLTALIWGCLVVQFVESTSLSVRLP